MLAFSKRKSLVLSTTIMLSILFVSVITVMVWMLYTEQKNAAFDNFRDIGEKLGAQAQVSSSSIDSVAQAYVKSSVL
ncbi:hypothetical protein A8990_1217 [Paenibacillus taihuensis]|uniref:Uncharacterized protein n=1 Tax=Paenibacillus taihuensis TaxID=1156355 RepID=A0A3D9RKU0_9BACL|nr:hypothetical protein A8990_1217 [Paenibacillus taihuensis]